MAKWRLRLFWAVLLAVAAGWGTKAYLDSLQETVPVVVAAQPIPARSHITPEMVRVVSIHRNDQTLLAADAFQSVDEVVNRYTRRRIEAGELLRDRPSDVTEPGEARLDPATNTGALADFLPHRTRAVTLHLDGQAVLGHNLRPHDRVDVVYTSGSDSTGGVYSHVILQQLTVLDIQRVADDPFGEVLVTLLVTPEQAVDLTLAKRTGTVDLVLVPREAEEPTRLLPATPLKFTGDAAPPEATDANDGGQEQP